MKFIISLLAALAWACVAFAAEPVLVLVGDTKIVEVPRTVIVLDKVQVVTSLPFLINAPSGGALYVWSYPATVTATKLGGVLTITAAPKGPLTVSAEWIIIDFEAKKFESKSASLAFAVGGIDPPKPIDPVIPAPMGFRVLLVHEAMEAAPAFFDGRAVKTYLDSKTVKDANHPSWRRIDQNHPGANLPKELKLLWEAAKPKLLPLPCVVIAVNEAVTIHALPKDEIGLIQLLELHGGK